jgi:hypothetical protein
MGDGSVEVGARDIHYLTDVIEDMRHSARNLPGLEVWIDNPHREEGTDDREINRDYQKPVVTRHARLARRKAKT